MPLTPEQTADGLTKAQRDTMAGHLVDIPPEEAEALEEAGLKGDAYFTDERWGRRMVWPVTPLGLQVRAALKAQENPHAD